MSNTKKLTLAAMFVALGVTCSAFYIPVGIAKCFPVQHLINVLAGTFLGPVYAVSMAFATSLIRVLTGTGSLLAFPGSICGAFLCALLYKLTNNNGMAFLGEVIGTGIIGSLLAVPIASLFMSKTSAIFAFVIPFGLSSLGGAIFAMVIILSLRKTGILKKLN